MTRITDLLYFVTAGPTAVDEEAPTYKEIAYLSIALGNRLEREFLVAEPFIITARVCLGLLYIFPRIVYLVLNETVLMMYDKPFHLWMLYTYDFYYNNSCCFGSFDRDKLRQMQIFPGSKR
jgi:hypothetical protein